MTSLERPQDEMANVITHGMGFLFSLAAAAFLVERVHQQSTARIVACDLYSASLILVFGASTLSHLCYSLDWRRRFRTLDQASIFLLIAGTYTPFATVYLCQGRWYAVLIIMWLLALLGVLRTVHVRDLSRNDKVLFGVMGFLPSVTLTELSRRAPTAVIVGIILGGACYSIGAIFLRFSGTVRYSHAIWHTFVVAGGTFHYWAVLVAISDHCCE